MNAQHQPTQESIDVRLANERDTHAISEFTRAIARETENLKLDAATVRGGVQAVFSDPQLGFYIVATSGSEVIGCLMISYEWSDWRNGVQWWLQSVYIDERYRRKGVLTKMYSFVRNLASTTNSVCGIRLYVERNNKPAIAAYETLGLRFTDYLVYEMPLDSSDQMNQTESGESN